MFSQRYLSCDWGEIEVIGHTLYMDDKKKKTAATSLKKSLIDISFLDFFSLRQTIFFFIWKILFLV